MRVTIDRAGRHEEVEVDPDLSSVTVDGKKYPVTVVSRSATKVEVEIAGERAVVEGWYDHFPKPPGPVDVNGERWTVAVETAEAVPAPAAAAAAPAPGAAAPKPTPGAAAVVPPPHGVGTPILPPMPGKVVELRVKDGDRVAKGDVLLVLEAMKMRNEIVAPTDGVVRYVRVAPGSNARAKEPMLLIAPS
jgi:glutaconyl-CoA/methylmalonyl-CoA decarboxylase subunit gamma